MAAYRRVYDSRHLRADCQERDQLWNPTLGNRVWATFTFYLYTSNDHVSADWPWRTGCFPVEWCHRRRCCATPHRPAYLDAAPSTICCSPSGRSGDVATPTKTHSTSLSSLRSASEQTMTSNTSTDVHTGSFIHSAISIIHAFPCFVVFIEYV